MKKPKIGQGWDRFYRIIARIPSGRVSTYGAIAGFAGSPRAARHVGYALAALKGSTHDVPWHRVLGARSRRRAAVSLKDPVGGGIQRARLEAEGIEFDRYGQVSLERYGWAGPGARRPGRRERVR
jgi:methylated-DNA-protein-cysteine methyltransferase-like protein